METFVVMAALYFVFMMAGAFGYRVPPSGWTPAGWIPAGWTAPVASSNAMITANHVHVKRSGAFRSSGCYGACCA